MLRAVTRPDGSQVTFAYDALGRRIAKTYRGQTTHWVWDGNVPLHEWVEGDLICLADAGGVACLTEDAAIHKREAELAQLLAQGPPVRGSAKQPITWLFEPESFAPMAKLSAAGVLSIVCDHLGTPLLMADADGHTVWSASLTAWGEPLVRKGERLACPFRWPGQYEDVETGLYYNRFRYYDAEAGQYASQDPIGLLGGLRLHSYPGDPTAWVDPFGLSSQASAPPLAHVLECHGPGQGFTGVFDVSDGRVLLRPSSAEHPLPSGWVPRRGGHASVSRELGGNRSAHVGFAAIIREGGDLELTWRSGQLNAPPDFLVNTDVRTRITASVEGATGRKVKTCTR
jgi:RHS repeat-associated protein